MASALAYPDGGGFVVLTFMHCRRFRWNGKKEKKKSPRNVHKLCMHTTGRFCLHYISYLSNSFFILFLFPRLSFHFFLPCALISRAYPQTPLCWYTQSNTCTKLCPLAFPRHPFAIGRPSVLPPSWKRIGFGSVLTRRRGRGGSETRIKKLMAKKKGEGREREGEREKASEKENEFEHYFCGPFQRFS